MSRKRLLFDATGKVETPTFVLSTVGGKLLGQIPFIDESTIEVLDNFNDTSEISFDVYKTLNGELNPMWDQIKNFKLIWYREHNQCYIIQVDINDTDGLCKHVSGQSAGEVELGQILLHDIEINTEDDIARDDYKVCTLHNADDAEASILDRLLEKAPHYTLAHVDYTLESIQRFFSFDDKSIKDAFDDIAEEIGCVFVYDVYFEDGELKREINVYDLEYYCLNTECGERFEHGTVCPKCGGTEIRSPFGDDTGIIIDKDSLASEVSLETDVDSVKNCFMLEAGDDLMTSAVRMCMPSCDGYLWSFNSDTLEDMSDSLRTKIESYNTTYNYYNKTKTYDISDSSYAAVVSQYHDDDYADVTYAAEAVGFPDVINAYYGAITMYYYVKTSMMPTIDMSTVTASTSIADIKKGFADAGNSIAVSSFTSGTSAATVSSAVKNIAKMFFIQSQYEIDVAQGTLTTDSGGESGTWTGKITLTSRIDDGDDSTPLDSASCTLTLSVDDDYETYIQQQISRKLADADEENTGIVALFKKTGSNFSAALADYSYDCLDEYYQVCQTCINLLIEAGWGSASSDSHAYYTEMRDKLDRISAALTARNATVTVITNYESKMLDIVDDVHEALDLATCLGNDYTELAAYRREDTYTNDNYISDGLSDAELIDNAKLFLKAAEREIYKSSNLQHTISATVYNLMLMPEFEPLLENFEVGNWIRVIIDGVAYKLRLLSYTVNFGSIQNIDVTFSDMNMAGSGVADLSSIIAQASSMATSYGAVTRQAEKANSASSNFKQMLSQGLDLTNTKLVSNADHQEMVVDSGGLTMKKYDPIVDDYSDSQMKITNTTIAYTEDDWKTVKTAFGKYYDADGNEQYGVIGDSLVGRIIAGENLTIQSDKTDGSGEALFKVDADGVQLNNTSMHVTCDSGNAEIVIDPANGFVIGSTGVIASDGTVYSDKAKLWVDTDGNIQIKLSNNKTITQTIEDIDVGSVAVSTEYYLSTSAAELSDGEWVTEIPTADDEHYIWMRDVLTDSSGNKSYLTATCITSQEDDGTGVASVTTYYIALDTANVVPSTSDETVWSTDVIEQGDGKYVWVANKVVYGDGSSSWTSPVCITDSISRTQYSDLSGQVTDIQTQYTELSTTVDGINIAVGTISDVFELGISSEGLNMMIQNKIDDTTVDEVIAANETDGKQFIFNNKGLSVASVSGDTYGMKTLIDETGMVVSYKGSSVLQSTADGVIALNLHAQKYLKIGLNSDSSDGRSRFEDYGTGYTACYWI